LFSLYCRLANLFAHFLKGGKIYKLASDSMRKKFKKYFFSIFSIYGVAALLNPAMKLGGPQFWYETVYNGLALEDEELSKLLDTIASIKIKVQTIYNT